MSSNSTEIALAIIGGVFSTIALIVGGNKYQTRRVERQRSDPAQQVIENLKYIIKQKDQDNLELRTLLKEAEKANDRTQLLLREANKRMDHLESENRELKRKVQAIDPTYKGI